MKVKIEKGTDWYENKVGEEIEVLYSPIKRDGVHYYVAKTWDYYWKDKSPIINVKDCKVIDNSGSDFKDGYELGIAHGKAEMRETFEKTYG